LTNGDRKVGVALDGLVTPAALIVLCVDNQLDGLPQLLTDLFTHRHAVDLGKEQRGKSVAIHVVVSARAGDGQGDPALLEDEMKRLQERKTELKDTVERIIEKHIRDILAQQGIFNPIVESRISFPPLNFRLDEPPHLLVISPRNRIESMREITIKPSIVLEDIESIETEIDKQWVDRFLNPKALWMKGDL